MIFKDKMVFIKELLRVYVLVSVGKRGRGGGGGTVLSLTETLKYFYSSFVCQSFTLNGKACEIFNLFFFVIHMID